VSHPRTISHKKWHHQDDKNTENAKERRERDNVVSQQNNPHKAGNPTRSLNKLTKTQKKKRCHADARRQQSRNARRKQ